MKFHLAPLEGVSDCAFRKLCYEYGADVTYTEMVRVDGILRKNKATLAMLNFIDVVPTILQLLVVKPASARKFVAVFSSLGIKPVGINLNLGCPSPDVICEGGGAAMIKRVARVQEIVSILSELGLPVTIKMRLGLNEYEKKKKVYLNLINGVDCDGFIVHAEHARQQSFEKADWQVFSELLTTGKKIIANGNICTPEDVKYLSSVDVTEVMIGRAAMRNASVFRLLKGENMDDIAIVRARYEKLHLKYPSHTKYAANVLKHLER